MQNKNSPVVIKKAASNWLLKIKIRLDKLATPAKIEK
jgi:hypothetical protein